MSPIGQAIDTPTGFDDPALDELFVLKSKGIPLSQQVDGVATERIEEVVEAALAFRLARPVVVDVSDADTGGDLFRKAFELGADVVTANKKPLAGSLEAFHSVFGPTKGSGLIAEATVGAGLPVMTRWRCWLQWGPGTTGSGLPSGLWVRDESSRRGHCVFRGGPRSVIRWIYGAGPAVDPSGWMWRVRP